MKAWLVVNAFLQKEKFDEIHRWLCEAGRHRNVDISIRTNEELLSMCTEGGLALLPELDKVDFVGQRYFVGKNIRALRSKGI